MLRLLLDEHLSPTIAEQLARQRPALTVFSLPRWEEGRCLSVADDVLLTVAREQHLTLVTYDLRTVAPLLKNWGEQNRSQGGVIFVDDRTLTPNDFGGLVRALCQLWDAQGAWDWTDRVAYLRRQE